MAYKALYTGSRKAYKGLKSNDGLNWLIVVIVALFFWLKKRFRRVDDTLTIVYPDINPSVANTEVLVYSKRLLDAMNRFGTDEDTISEVFDFLQTGDDYKAVYNVFGKKPYNGWGMPNNDVLGDIDTHNYKDLTEWLKAEISPFSEPFVYRKIYKVLEMAGIPF